MSGKDTHARQAANETVTVTIAPYIPEDLRTEYADGLSVLTSEGVVVLTFLQAEVPILMKDQAVADVTGKPFRAKAVARLVVGETKMREFMAVLRNVMGDSGG